MNTIKALKGYAEIEINQGGQSSWHDDYRNSSYIFVANLNYDMNEGDIAIVFSQFGEMIDVHLVRDKITGKSKGFCFLAYEDQRSTVLAVDNFNHSEVCGRLIRVDHVREFKPPKEYLDIQQDDPQIFDKLYKPSGPDGRGWGEFRQFTDEECELMKQIKASEQEIEQRNLKILDNIQHIQDAQHIIDEDERWDKMLMIEDEKQQMLEKIAMLESYNQKMAKYVPQTKEKLIETNQERADRLNKKKRRSSSQQKKKRSNSKHKYSDRKRSEHKHIHKNKKNSQERKHNESKH